MLFLFLEISANDWYTKCLTNQRKRRLYSILNNLCGKLLWLDILSSDKKIGIKNATPAQCLQKILEDKWSLGEDDKDMIVMYHKFVYKKNEEFFEIT